MVLVGEEVAGRKKVPGPSLFGDTHCLLKLLGNLSLSLLFPLIISFPSSARKRILTDVKRLKSGKKKEIQTPPFFEGASLLLPSRCYHILVEEVRAHHPTGTPSFSWSWNFVIRAGSLGGGASGLRLSPEERKIYTGHLA